MSPSGETRLGLDTREIIFVIRHRVLEQGTEERPKVKFVQGYAGRDFPKQRDSNNSLDSVGPSHFSLEYSTCQGVPCGLTRLPVSVPGLVDFHRLAARHCVVQPPPPTPPPSIWLLLTLTCVELISGVCRFVLQKIRRTVYPEFKSRRLLRLDDWQ